MATRRCFRSLTSTLASCLTLAAAAVANAPAGSASPARSAPVQVDTALSPNILGLTAWSATDAWAVGYNDGYPAGDATFTAHWDGTSWQTVHSDPGTLIQPVLGAVAQVGPDDVWAVGHSYESGGVSTDNLAMHWNGKRWKVIPLPQPQDYPYRDLTSVAVVAPDRIYASGRVCDSEGPCVLEVLRYDGRHWSQVTKAPVDQLLHMDASSPDDALGVGAAGDESPDARSAHWDGSRWTAVSVPHSTNGDVLLDVTSADGTGWAAGAELGATGGLSQSLLLHWTGSAWEPASAIEGGSVYSAVSADASDDAWLAGDTGLQHWDGTQWSATNTPISTKPGTRIGDVVAVGADDALAVGTYNGPRCLVTVLMEYDGAAWSVTRTFGATYDSQLRAVSGVATDDVWSVGSRVDELFQFSSQLRHWNGHAWRNVPHPEPGISDSLNDVDARATDDVWAVGITTPDGQRFDPLIEHWDGSAWTVMDGLRAGPRNNHLTSVVAESSTDVWVTGSATSAHSSTPFVEHWDGQTWALATLPADVTSIGRLDVRSPSDVWLLGEGSTPDGLHTASVLHWDGSSWSTLFTAPYGHHRAPAYYLNDILVFSTTDVWVAGTQIFPGFYPGDIPYAFHWDGTTWTGYDTPTFPSQWDRSTFGAIDGMSSTDLWGVGTQSDYGHASLPLAEHWDGTSWQVATMPDLDPFAVLADVAVISDDDVWAVGAASGSNVVLHWNGHRWRTQGG